MSGGDVVLFNTAKIGLVTGIHDLNTHEFKLAICDNTVTPTEAMASPALASFTQVTDIGTYVLNGTILTITVNESNGIVTVDATNNPSYLLNALNDVDAYWGIIYNNTDAGKAAVAFVDLGGPINMQTDDLVVTWHPDGLFEMITV
jgi:hypothetical protein